ncbi:GNAT family N-acetyltransferase [Actinomyces sp. ZJ308]|uniref:GNAT family N-acetyltransferase n=1 Tax=Actinomyces sp. ZJ308 TaxID=2708342 RepID=UPI001421D7A4|nr:GNAT family N-acetyltransferase [Actinomyces sp. ZJ308]
MSTDNTGGTGSTGGPVRVRLAEPSDYEAVRALLLRAYESRFWITSAYRSMLLDIEGHVADPRPDGHGGQTRGEDLLLAVDGETILGAVFVPRDTQTGPDGAVEQSFGRLGVDPASAGRGVARTLVEHVEDLARERGAERIAIHSGPQMHGAHRMYEHLGYRRRPEREDLVVDSGQRLLVYTRELDRSDDVTGVFGQADLPVASGRYRLLASAADDWSRLQTIVLRLTGLDQHVAIEWTDDGTAGTAATIGVRGPVTPPAVYDSLTDRLINSDGNLLSYEWVTAWRSLHGVGAPDLYPVGLRDEIDALNQQLFDDVNNGPYKVLFAGSLGAARVAKGVWEARLAELDFRLASRRYLFGERLTDSDVRLFVTLASFDQGYRPSFPAELGAAARITDFPYLWAYARDLHATPGFATERELRATGILTQPDGRYTAGVHRDQTPVDGNPLARWSEPAGREHLGGSPPPSAVSAIAPWRRQRMWTAARHHETDREDPEFMAACTAQRQ